MLVVILSIFVRDTKIISVSNFGALLIPFFMQDFFYWCWLNLVKSVNSVNGCIELKELFHRKTIWWLIHNIGVIWWEKSSCSIIFYWIMTIQVIFWKIYLSLNAGNVSSSIFTWKICKFEVIKSFLFQGK